MESKNLHEFPRNNEFESLMRYASSKVIAMAQIAPVIIDKIVNDDSISDENKSEAIAVALFSNAYINGLIDAARSERNLDISNWLYGLRLRIQAVLPELQRGFDKVSEELGDRPPNDRRN